jgi:hypothetical protein
MPETNSDRTPAPSEESVVEESAAAPSASTTGDEGDLVAADDAVVLDQLEADLAAVEHAISTLDRVTAEGVGGESAASQIAVAVSPERFGGDTTG